MNKKHYEKEKVRKPKHYEKHYEKMLDRTFIIERGEIKLK